MSASDLPPDRFRAAPDTPADGAGTAEVATWTRDLRTDRVSADPAMARLFGVAERDARDGPFAAYLAAIHPDDLARTEDSIRRAVETGDPYEAAYRVRGADGRYRHVTARGRVEHDPDGTPARMAGVVVDVTRRHEAEAALRATEVRYRALFEAIDQGFCVIEVLFAGDRADDFRFLQVNPAFERLTGLTGVVGHTCGEVAPAYRGHRLAIYGRVARTGVPVRFEDAVGTPGGRWFEIHAFPSGPGDRVAVLFDDVTARKLAEADLFASRETLRAVLDGIPQRVFWKATDLTYLGCNRPFARDMGFDTPAEVVGKDDYAGSWAAIADVFRADDRRIIDSGEAKLDYDEILEGVDGARSWVRTSKQPLRGPDGRVVGVLGTYEDMTARKRAEDDLRLRDRAIGAATQGFIITDPARPDNPMVYASPGFERITGYTAAEAVGRNCRLLQGPGTDPAAVAQLRTAIRDRRTFGIELLNYRRDGAPFWNEVTVSPVTEPDGTVTHFVGVLTDVTERRHREQQLAASEARFRTLIEALPDAVLIHAGDRVAFCNPACLRLLGATEPSQVVDRNPLDLVPPAFRDRIVRRLEALRRTGTPEPGSEVELLRVDGTTVPVLATDLPIADAGADAVLVVFHDLSERRRVERQLHNQEALLREAAELAHVGGWGFDPVTMEADWTDETARIHGLDPAAGPQGVAAGIARFAGEDRARLEAAIRAAIERGTPYDLELDFTAVSGEKKRVRTICRPVVDGGRVVRVRGSLQDITARYRLEEQFRQSQKMEAFGQLAGGVAHDFNNLLTVINGYCDLLLESLPPADAARRVLAEVRKAGERSAALTRQLLAFSRKQVVAPRVLDPNAVVGDLASLLRRLIGEDVRLDTIFAAGAWPVLADPGQLEQVLMNLCVNARDAMPTGGRLTIETRNATVAEAEAADHPDARPGPHAVLAVTDTGTGMSAGVRARLFEPFFTTKGVGQGTGLGLATVYGIVRQTGGHVRVRSVPGAGSTFAVYLPCAGSAAVAEDAAGKSGIRAAAKGSETVLVVEDEDGVRAFIRAVLEGCGYRVIEAGDGEDAERTAAAYHGPIHLLVSDVVMPGVGGRIAAERVLALHPETRVLFVSGYTDDAVVRHGVRADSVQFLQKPFAPAALALKARHVLDAVL